MNCAQWDYASSKLSQKDIFSRRFKH